MYVLAKKKKKSHLSFSLFFKPIGMVAPRSLTKMETAKMYTLFLVGRKFFNVLDCGGRVCDSHRLSRIRSNVMDKSEMQELMKGKGKKEKGKGKGRGRKK